MPYTHSKYRSEIVREETKLQKGKMAVKYWYMNLAYRWTGDFSAMESVKMIYDMQDASIFIFCTKSYSDWFSKDYLTETQNFKENQEM